MTVSPTTLTVNEGEETTYTIVLDSQPAGDVTVAIHDPADNSDVTPEPGNLLFYTSTWNVPQQVKVYADWDDDRDNETVTITHSASGGGYDGASIGDVTITVSDAAPPTPTGVALTVTPDEVSEAAGDTTVTVTASLQGDGALAGETTVTLTLSGGSGSDYTAGALPTITIGAGESSGTAEFTLTPTDDVVVEGGETITLSGAHSGGLTVSGATITLTDDDRATLTIGGPSDAVDEGSDAEFTVNPLGGGGRGGERRLDGQRGRRQ